MIGGPADTEPELQGASRFQRSNIKQARNKKTRNKINKVVSKGSERFFNVKTTHARAHAQAGRQLGWQPICGMGQASRSLATTAITRIDKILIGSVRVGGAADNRK